MALFPEKINNRYAAILTVDTDYPPSKICLAFFDRLEDMWDPAYWQEWQKNLDNHILKLQRSPVDHIEVGAPPLKTDKGWLILFSYIENYLSPPMTFGIEAALLQLDNPAEIIATTNQALMAPQEEYELYGQVSNIIFPSGALIVKNRLRLFYGAADSLCAMATVGLDELIKEIIAQQEKKCSLTRFSGNPIITPGSHNWEAEATFNPAIFYYQNKIHLLYRAMAQDNTSVFGYASSSDGFHFDERLDQPIYLPRADFEQKLVPGGNSGCEDPRLTLIDKTLYILYTAYDGQHPPRVALSSIGLDDFLSHNWNWQEPKLISPPDIDDKDAALFPDKINGKYVFLHRLGINIWIDFIDNLDYFDGKNWLGGKLLLSPRHGPNDSRKIGIAGPPLKTNHGWLLIYHGVSKKIDGRYNLRAALLDLNDPTKIIARSHFPILEAVEDYEREGQIKNVVFSCGSAVINDQLFVYYGGADTVCAVATIKLSELLDKLLIEGNSE